MGGGPVARALKNVIPAEAGIQAMLAWQPDFAHVAAQRNLGSRLRGNDGLPITPILSTAPESLDSRASTHPA